MKNETKKTAQHWKKLTAQALNKPELADAPDEQLEAAHADHVALIKKMEAADDGSMIRGGLPPWAAATGNEAQRRAGAQVLINELMATGKSYDEAFNLVRTSRPDLISNNAPLTHR